MRLFSEFEMWRFIEEGPLLKFPLRESPFMSADPMYRDVVVAPPIRYQKPSVVAPSENSFQSSTSSKHDQSNQSSSTVGLAQDLNSIPSIQPKKQQRQQNNQNSFSYSSANDL